VFDVEIIARFKRAMAAHGVEIGSAIYEMPLREWHDVGGSKLALALAYLVASPAGARERQHTCTSALAEGVVTVGCLVHLPQIIDACRCLDALGDLL
jgi:hypothetical protein